MLTSVMPRRPDLGKEHILSREDLQQLRHSLAHLSLSAVRDIYERVYQEVPHHQPRLWLGHVSLDTTNHYAQANFGDQAKSA